MERPRSHPTAKLLYTIDARAIAARAGTALPTIERSNFGRALLAGRVVDTAGEPVEGAAIRIGSQIVFTDSHGSFFYRERKPEEHGMSVAVEQFLDGERYAVISAPTTMASSLGWGTVTTIVVNRLGRTGDRASIASPVPPPRDPSDIFGPYVPYRPGTMAPTNLKPGAAIPAPMEPGPQTPTSAVPVAATPVREEYGPYVPYIPPEQRARSAVAR